jgi:ribosomal protein S1
MGVLVVCQRLEKPIRNQSISEGTYLEVSSLTFDYSILKQSLSVDVASKKVEMSFRSENLTRESISTRTLADFSEGQKIDGRVKKIEDYGLFIEIEGCKISGLCHRSQVLPLLIANLPYH